MKRESQQELFYAGIPTFVGSDYVEIEDCKDYDIAVMMKVQAIGKDAKRLLEE